jgi:hypothetical protein
MSSSGMLTPCDSCKNRRFGETYRLNHQGDNNRRARNSVSINKQPKHAAKKYPKIIMMHQLDVDVGLTAETRHMKCVKLPCVSQTAFS